MVISEQPRMATAGHIPFVVPTMTGNELACMEDAVHRRSFLGGGHYTKLCESWLKSHFGAAGAFLMPSGTAALELAVILADVAPGDEVIMPSFTFSSTANAVALRGGVAVFVDIRDDNMNIDEAAIEAAITPRTKAILAVHYAGVPAEMDVINAIAAKHGLMVIEDAAQALLSSYHGRPAGALGQMAAISFHATKNIQCGEGGALIVMDPTLAKRAEIVREKGTNRSAFFRGEVDKYSWVDIGSSFLLNEMSAAFLSAQLENAGLITEERLATWNFYHEAFAPLEEKQLVRRPIVPSGILHNAHIYYLLLPGADRADQFLVEMRKHGIHPTTHYVPLHSAPAGRKFGRAVGPMTVTDRISDRLIRLPLWCGMSKLKHVVFDRAVALLEA